MSRCRIPPAIHTAGTAAGLLSRSPSGRFYRLGESRLKRAKPWPVPSAAHEAPQELGDFAVLVHGGWSKPRALLLNFLYIGAPTWCPR